MPGLHAKLSRVNARHEELGGERAGRPEAGLSSFRFANFCFLLFRRMSQNRLPLTLKEPPGQTQSNPVKPFLRFDRERRIRHFHRTKPPSGISTCFQLIPPNSTWFHFPGAQEFFAIPAKKVPGHARKFEGFAGRASFSHVKSETPPESPPESAWRFLRHARQ
jgi:hypothetical protein